jgi:uncharacterized OsmC-like protein
MNEELVYNRARSYTSGTPGRALNQVRNHYFVVDDPSLGEALGAADIFLAGISACAANQVTLRARDSGYLLRYVDVAIEGVREKRDTSWFKSIALRVLMEGVDAAQGADLVEQYKGH